MTDSAAGVTTARFSLYRSTGKERDTESGGGSQWSGNDYFGARYYASSMGRFMSPDWVAIPAPIPYGSLYNPQSLNLYSYVLNNPLGGVDPDGHLSCKDAPGLCAAIRDAVSHGGTIADGWAAHANSLAKDVQNGVKGAEKALDKFNTYLGFGKTNCAGGGSCQDALGQAAGAVIAGVASDGASEEGVVETQLAGAGAKIDRIIGRVTEEDLAAAEREANGGMSVAKPGGGEYSHVEELTQYANGLDRQARHLERMLNRSGLSESQVNRLNGYIERARGEIDVIRKATGGGVQ